MKALPIQRRTAVLRPEGYCAIRVSHRAERKSGQGHVSPRYLLRCGCCDRAVQIYYDTDALEINGVHGSIENWREILLPLLGMKRRGKYVVAELIKPKRKVDPDEILSSAEAKTVRRGEAQLKGGESKSWRAVKNALSP
jgi:hypothetical protein